MYFMMKLLIHICGLHGKVGLHGLLRQIWPANSTTSQLDNLFQINNLNDIFLKLLLTSIFTFTDLAKIPQNFNFQKMDFSWLRRVFLAGCAVSSSLKGPT
jgi:hypothetical protein